MEVVNADWYRRLDAELSWTAYWGPTCPLHPLLSRVDSGALETETPQEFNARLHQLYQAYKEQRSNNVVGGLQERSQSGNDPGDDEDRAGREDERPGLRGRGEVRLSRSDYNLNWH